jgi:oligoendopeptidase F
MEVATSIEALRTLRSALKGRVGLVPTMGALHPGHESLVRQARTENDSVIVTIFVNPTQFAPNEDLAAYPRDLPGDLKLLQQAGADLIFTPTAQIMYPDGYQTFVEVGAVAEGLEGGHRPGHFRGVATIVSKLFNLTQPHIAYFGQKDAQQVVVIRRMVYDLNIPVEIAVCPTVREPDGLAKSSRNVYLSPEQRAAAPVLYQALQTAGILYEKGERHPQRLRKAMRDVLDQEPLANASYVSAADANTLRELEEQTDAPILLSLAVQIGRARLIDNMLLPLHLNNRDGLAHTLGNPVISNLKGDLMFDRLPAHAEVALQWGIEEYQPYLEELQKRELNAATVDQWLKDWSRVTKLAQEVYSRLSVATTIDTTDTQAEAQYEHFIEQVQPALRILNNALNIKLVESGLKPEGFEIPLRKIRTEIDLFREENLPLLTEQAKLNIEYDKVAGAQTVQWQGEEVTLDQLLPELQSTDRDIRERAWRLSMQRRLQDRATFNKLWQKFMNLRGKIAANAGVEDFRAYQWLNLKRFDYTPEDSASFHQAIEQVVVPAAHRLYQKRQQRLGLDTLRPWDTEVDASGRTPLRPYQTVSELEEKSEAIFRQVDPALGDYFRIMREEKLLDLDNRKGKAPGGYCTDFPVAGRPFIFMNGVGIHDDVQTMLHEGGHAFHLFESLSLPYHHQVDAPIEFCEVASMAMELLGAPYLGHFYSETDAARARVEHLEGMLRFWPYMAVVDSFQHWVYTHHAEASNPTNCDTKWGELWDRFMVGIDYSGLEDEKVTGWQRKLHIFQIPFYYIEYGLAQLGAAQVWANALQDQQQAMAQYRAALKQGGTKSIPELFQIAGAKFAFDAVTLQRSVDLIEQTIEMLDPS